MDRVSFIQQQYGLFRWKTVRKNLALPLLLKKTPRAEIQARVARELARLGLEGLEDKFPSQLSGGQCQRVAIGRALIDEPEVLLIESGVTLVLVTHSIEEAVYVCDHLLVYSKDSETPQVIDNTKTPQDRYDAAFVAQCARVKAMLEGGESA